MEAEILMDDDKFMWLKKLCLQPSAGKLPPDEQPELDFTLCDG